MDKSKRRLLERTRRAARVRTKISGTSERPRLCVRRSISHVYAQVIDDVKGETIAQVASFGKSFQDRTEGKKDLTKTDISKLVGEMIAEKAMEKGVTSVVFDRKGYLFHGRIKALVEAARSKGLVF
ncbi:50S ribosomal protein L18p (L5e) [Chitinispirillum alkaliphilum]|nr:50S ribosomal protein L18p (L5e) [Chitinispirillum alkaliphilum]